MSDHTQSTRPDVGLDVRGREAAMDEMVADAESMGFDDQGPGENREALRLARHDRNRAQGLTSRADPLVP